MQPLPHRYRVRAGSSATGDVDVTSPGLATLSVQAPAEFGGPGDRWSPETLLTAAVASCLILTFRAIARASRLVWTSLDCDVQATLDKTETGSRFTVIDMRVDLQLPDSGDEERARRLVAKAKQGCLVTNSLNAETNLSVNVSAAGGS